MATAFPVASSADQALDELVSILLHIVLAITFTNNWNLGWKLSWSTSAVQKIKKLSETPVTVHNIAKLCVIDGKNREITKKLVQPVPPHPYWPILGVLGVPKMALGVTESKF